MAKEYVEPRVGTDTTTDYKRVRGVHESNVERRLNLIFKRTSGKGYLLQVDTDDGALAEKLPDGGEYLMDVNDRDLFGYVQRCRETWHQEVVDFPYQSRARRDKIFQNHWDLSSQPEVLRRALPGLAVAGKKLFLQLFHSNISNRQLAGVLRQAMAEARHEGNDKIHRPIWIRVTSDEFFAPWNLIYSEPLKADGSDARKEGFWGYHNLIEHVTSGGSQGNELAVSEPLKLTLQLDRNIDTKTEVPCLKPVLEHLDTYQANALKREERNERDKLLATLGQGPLDEHVSYFCCHGQQEGDSATVTTQQEGFLTLTDPRRITTSDVVAAIDLKTFQQHPIVFLNACGGGQENSLIFEGFSEVFLGSGASCVIGPQTDVPAVFAGEFARCFFADFFQGRKRKVGDVLFGLRQKFFDDYLNPLGLIYSPYRGADVMLEKPLGTVT